ncbi:MAG TPA: SHOCT domain-containing protein [Actinomycetota bacterium]|jgi:putative membrane protein|nr:SHOCT domain-containing protein [Actinomycetota bacterium]
MQTALAVVGHAGWGWWWIFPFAWIVLIALFWTFAWRGHWWGRRAESWHDARSPESVLGERYARGEIDEQEYRSRLAVLRERR